MFNFVEKRKIFFTISGALIMVSIIALALFGLNLGIDFTGGTMMQVSFSEKVPSIEKIKNQLNGLKLSDITVQKSGEDTFIMQFKSETGAEVKEATHQEIVNNLNNLGEFEEETYTSIGPVIGKQLTQKAKISLILALLAIILYVAWAFRKVARFAGKRESWRYGLGALAALFHDVIILLGFFAVFGHFAGVEVNVAFVTALLTVLGYSVNDTIVIYDRIRENIVLGKFKNLASAINHSLNETIIRSLNTSLTTLFVLLVIYLFGGASIQSFILAMMIGIGVGTYSSIAIASPFLLLKRDK